MPTGEHRPKALGALLPLPVLIIVAACGGAGIGAGAAGGPVAPSSSGAPAATGSAAEAPPSASVAPGPAPVPAASSASPPESAAEMPAQAIEMKAPIPSAMVDDLRALGLDPAHLPPIEKVEPRALRGVMKLMSKSLGVKCGDCHEQGDFAAPTPRKRIAAHMWDDFVARLAMSDGSALFCDSCHQGRVRQLDRRDKKVLAKWMDDTFVAKLTRIDSRTQDCETCHVDMEMNLLAKWGGGH